MRLTAFRILFISVIAVLLASAATAEAKKLELLDGKIIIGGQARFRFEYFDNTNFTTTPDRQEFVLTRIRPDFEFRPHEQIILFFQPQFTAGWGETGASLTTVNSTTDGTAATTSGTLNDPVLGIHQGYMIYEPINWFYLKLGRQELVYGDQLVIGNVDWNNVGRSFDAGKLRFMYDQGWVDVFFSYLSDAESGTARGVSIVGPAGDALFTGAYSTLNLGRFLRALDFYLLYLFDDTASPRPFNFVTGGMRIKSKPSAWDYRLEITGEIGKPLQAANAGSTQKAYQVDLEGGYNFGTDEMFRVGFEGFIASVNYNQLFPTAHKWLGYIDLFSRRNIMGGVFHFAAKPTEKWLFKLDAHTFFRTSTTNGLFRLNGVTPIGATGSSTSHFAGEEIDLTAKFQALDILSFQAGFNVFIPAGFIDANVGSELPIFGYLQSNLLF